MTEADRKTLEAMILARLRRVDPEMAGDMAFELGVERSDVAKALESLRRDGRVVRHGLHWMLSRRERQAEKQSL